MGEKSFLLQLKAQITCLSELNEARPARALLLLLLHSMVINIGNKSNLTVGH